VVFRWEAIQKLIHRVEIVLSLLSLLPARKPNEQTKSPSLPPNMQWLSNGNDKSKEPIAYQCLLVDFPDEFRTYSADNFFQYLVERLKDFLSFSKRVPQVVIFWHCRKS
jgi:hypothetical protein